jgi:hypothetical protein
MPSKEEEGDCEKGNRCGGCMCNSTADGVRSNFAEEDGKPDDAQGQPKTRLFGRGSIPSADEIDDNT